MSRQARNDAIDHVFDSEFPVPARGSEREKEADDDEMKPDSEYARGRRTGKGPSQVRHQDWEMYEPDRIEHDRVL